MFFLAFVIRTLLAEGYAVNPETGEVFMEPYKYPVSYTHLDVYKRQLGSCGMSAVGPSPGRRPMVASVTTVAPSSMPLTISVFTPLEILSYGFPLQRWLSSWLYSCQEMYISQ